MKLNALSLGFAAAIVAAIGFGIQSHPGARSSRVRITFA